MYALVHRICFWILLAFASSFIIRCILLLDPNKRVYNHTPGPCRVLTEKYKGASALHLVESQKRVYIGYGTGKSFGLKTKSGVAYYEMKTMEENQKDQQNMYKLVEMTINWNGYNLKHFVPTSISSYSSSSGRILLYIISSHPTSKCVHFFSVDKSTLSHRKALCDQSFTSIQHITVVGADRFFITNLAYFERGNMQLAELSMQAAFGSVYLYDGKNLTMSIKNFPSPTAIQYDADRKLLYVASMLNEIIKVYKVNADNSLTPKTEISILTSPMGIHIDRKSGDIWVACHPVMFQTMLDYYYADDENVRSPSQVLRIRVQEDGVSWVITEPYANDGATISASAGVVYSEEQMLIGSAFGRLLHCDVLNPQIT